MAGTFLWLLVIVVCGVPMMCWWFLSRDPVVRISVGVVLGMCAAAVAAVFAEWTFFTSQVEALFSYPLVAAVLISLGLGYERCKLGAPQRRSRSIPPGGVLVAYLAMALLCGAPMYVITYVESGRPNSRQVLPLPSDLRMVDDPSVACGSGACHLRIEVAGRGALTPQQAARRLREHVRDRGWNVNGETWACHRAGFWFDRTSLCVRVYVDGRYAALHLEQARGSVGG